MAYPFIVRLQPVLESLQIRRFQIRVDESSNALNQPHNIAQCRQIGRDIKSSAVINKNVGYKGENNHQCSQACVDKKQQGG